MEKLLELIFNKLVMKGVSSGLSTTCWCLPMGGVLVCIHSTWMQTGSRKRG